MKLTSVKGTVKARVKKTSLQIDLLGAMIDRGAYSQREVAARLKVSPQTLSQHLRGHRKNPHVLRKILRFLGKEPGVISLDSRMRGNDGRRTAA